MVPTRSVPNQAVTSAQYRECIASFVGEQDPMVAFGAAELVDQLWRLTPFGVILFSPLLTALVKSGLGNACMAPLKFEIGLRERIGAHRARHPQTNFPSELATEKFISAATEHIRHCLTMLREYKFELTTTSKRKKAQAFKRQCTSTDHAVLRNLTALLDLPKDDTHII